MNERQLILFLFVFSFINAVYEIVTIREIAVNYILRLSANMIIGLSILGFGIGAYFSKFLQGEENLRTLGILNAIFVFLALIFVLIFLPANLTPNITSLIKTVIGISPPFIILGAIHAKVYSICLSKQRNLISKFIACGLLGFALGSFLAPELITILGANTVAILIVFISLIFSFNVKYRHIFLLLVLLFLLIAFPTENYIENFRLFKPLFWEDIKSPELLYSGWSPYYKIDVYKFDGECLAVLYNLRQQFYVCPNTSKDVLLRKITYNKLIQKNDKVLIIGAGGGMGVLTALENHPKKLVAVEIDPLVIELFKNRYSSYNNHVYSYGNVEVVVKDGRSFLDETNEIFDKIILEGTDFTLTSAPNSQVEIENYLYTVQGFKSMLKHLSSDGLIALVHIANIPQSSRIYHTLKEIGAFVEVIKSVTEEYPVGHLEVHLILVTKEEKIMRQKLKEIVNELPNSKVITNELVEKSPITDDRPFFYFYDKSLLIEPIKNIIILLLSFVIVMLTINFFMGKNVKIPVYFLLVGSGFILSELFIISKFRSFFGDTVLTIAIVTALFVCFTAIGSYYSQCIYVKLKGHRSLLVFLLISAYLYNLLNYLQFLPSNWLLKLIISLITLAPYAVLIGIFFPTGLRQLNESQAASAYAADMLGTALGLFSFFVISMCYGFSTVFYLIVIIYVLVISILRRTLK